MFLTCGYALKQVSLPTETDAYADGDVLFAAVQIPDVAIHNGDTVLLDAVKLIDDDEIKPAIDLIFFKSEVAIGDVNDAAEVPAGAEYLATVKLVASDYTDLGDISIAEKKNVNRDSCHCGRGKVDLGSRHRARCGDLYHRILDSH